MPCLKIFTSLTKDKIPENFVKKIIPVLSEAVHKPEDKFIIMVSAECSVYFYGQSANKPSAVATLESIGNLGLEENKTIIKEVTQFIQKELGIAPEQMSFYDLRGQDIGKGGVTLA